MKNWTNIIMLKGLLSKNWALLKSDHFGIEIILLVQLTNVKQLKLKSDHFGIEIYKPLFNLFGMFLLKSDHFGIEIMALSY